MLEFKSEKMSIKFNDKIYTLDYPTVDTMRGYDADLEEEKTNEMELVVNLLDTLGLKRSVTDKMTMSMLNSIIGELVKTKK